MDKRKAGSWCVTFFLVSVLQLPGSPGRAEVIRVVVERTEDVLDGREWGEAGAYEKLVGQIHFAFDPTNPANASIVDLRFATTNGNGMVVAWADFMVLQPKDPGSRRGVAWVEVSNRGGKASLRYFNRASRSTDPVTEEDFGDGLLLEEGFTIIWLGWQWDVPESDGLLKLHVPVARLPGEPIEGLVRADWTVDDPTEILHLGHRGHRAYGPISPDHPENQLTVRSGRMAPREVIPRERWWFLPEGGAPSGELDGAQLTRIALEGGFRAGSIYELVYRSQDPRVVGLGLAAIRDVISYAKYELDSVFPVTLGIAFGVSQTGRFLRHFLYQGFNTDEGGRKAFDGMLIHTAGAGRGSFNHRFGQPSRDAHRYSAFFYPTDLFPFTSSVQRDPVSDREDGLFAHQDPEDLPLVFYTNTGYEYWGRAGSLIHTSVSGTQDVPPLANERIYHLSSAQHSGWGFPPNEEARLPGNDIPVYRGNPVDLSFPLRALAIRLTQWVEGEREPPSSRYPRIADGTLVPPEGLAFPEIPGVAIPKTIHEAYRVDYGPQWWSEGIVHLQPPELRPPFPSQVSQVDGFGNEMAGVRGWELRAPIGTYAPWN
ncbi:MAG: hypothetical protein KJN92_15395, partial [Gemmatimonadetes bacterium]|nr:hypothetical protein [Gemmatimonadota bacterium]